MTPAEREDLRDLTMRLFGVDGQGGAIGGLSQTLKDQNATLETQSKTLDVLMNDKRAAENATVERRRINDKRESVRLVLASVIGGGIVSVVVAIVLGLLGIGGHI